MLRTFFISLSKSQWIQQFVMNHRFTRRTARRFVTGENIAEAISAVQALNQHRILATLDHLGENVSTAEEARQSTDEVLVLLNTIVKASVKANVSVKLSQLGLLLSDDLCRENLTAILKAASELHNFIRIDMEDSSLTSRTIEMYFWARENGFERVGIVQQAYLFRAADDVDRLMQVNARVRLCKGAYKEPAGVAFPSKQDVDHNYDRLVEKLLIVSKQAGESLKSADGLVPPMAAIATHDRQRIDFAIQQLEMLGLPKQEVEFQMLYGIRRDLQDDLAQQGYPVRVYVPYGTHWYPYFMRRLAERPANLWFFINNFFKA